MNCPNLKSGFRAASTDLADGLQRGRLDVAFLRCEPKPDLEYRLVTKEPLVVILPRDHPLAEAAAIAPLELAAQAFIGISDVAPVLRSVIRDYLKRSGVEIAPTLQIDNYVMAMSLVTSTRGVALLPASVKGYLPASVISRPLAGEQPTIDLLIGYHRANPSPSLKKFLSGIDELAVRIYGQARSEQASSASGFTSSSTY